MSRLQEERSAETRQRLIDATIQCLYERGYASITTAEIAARAGVSKGAQLHHFPSKEKLVIAALEHLFELRVTASRDPETIKRLPKDLRRRLAAVIDTLVPVYADKVFYAWLELVVASRRELFGSPEDDPERFRLLSDFINGQFAAMAMGRILLGGGGEDPEEFSALVDELKELGSVLLHKTLSRRRKP